MYRQHIILRIRFAIAILVLILFAGVVGYSYIEEFDFLDSLYMTVITVTTVGFREIHEFSPEGKVFTIILILTSWVAFAYALSVITTYFVEGEINSLLKVFRNKSEIKRMDNHVIVVGYGRNGRQAVQELKLNRHPFVVVEKDHELIIAKSDKGMAFIEGDATEDETLINAGIRNARALITTLPIDADNLFVSLTARSLKPDLHIVSRASNESSEKKLHVAGVNSVVLPEKVGGEQMAALVLNPDVLEFLNHISVKGSALTNLEEIFCSDLPSELKYHKLNELEIRRKTGANIIGFKTPEGEFIINPTPETQMIPNSKLFVLGTPEQIATMKKVLNLK